MARKLAARQAALKAAGQPRIAGPKVLAALMGAGAPARLAPPEAVWQGPDGARVVAKSPGRGRVTLTVEGAGDMDATALERLAGWLGERIGEGKD